MESKVERHISPKKVAAFRKAVWGYYKTNGRHDLPWRKTSDPYRILVSEVMLQQTQVPRVIEKYKEFLKAFPTVKKLAQAPLSNVLRIWSGLGYNRRGKYLHDAAKEMMRRRDKKSFVGLPGVGPYTLNAIRVFAFNELHALIETNVRAAIIHHFYSSVSRPTEQSFGRVQKTSIGDKDILPVAEKAAEGQDPREWHWALMDYGVHIKKLYKNPARRSAHYVRQSKFEGSLRQVRGEILRQLMKGNNGLKGIKGKKGERALAGLMKDGLIKEEKSKLGRPRWRIA